MLIRLFAKCPHGKQDFDLINILRALAQQNTYNVFTRYWRVSDLDIATYGDYDQEGTYGGYDQDALALMFPERPRPIENYLIVPGERLMERSALLLQFGDGLFLRLVDPKASVEVVPDFHLWKGPPTFQATNVDLEIRREEAAAYEVVSMDEKVISCLDYHFAETEIE